MINIAEILKNCPEGTELYSPIFGECTLKQVFKSNIYVLVKCNNDVALFNKYGQYDNYMEECLLFPFKDNRNWNTFKKAHFFKPFDRVVGRYHHSAWRADFYSHYEEDGGKYPYKGLAFAYDTLLPYNEETAKLIGTTDEYKE